MTCTKASSFCSLPWHMVALASAAPRPALCPWGFGAGSDACSPWQCLPGSRVASSLTPPHRHPWLGVGGSWAFSCHGPRSSPCCIHPPASSEQQPSSSSILLSRAEPDCPFISSPPLGIHLPLPPPPGTVPFFLLIPWAIQRGTCTRWGAEGAPGWPEPAGSSEGPCVATVLSPSGWGQGSALTFLPTLQGSSWPMHMPKHHRGAQSRVGIWGQAQPHTGTGARHEPRCW